MKDTVLKRIIKKKMIKYLQRLKLDENLNISFKYSEDICLEFNVQTNKGRLHINLGQILNFVQINNLKNLYIWKMFPLNSVNKRIDFIICHELSHYLQFKKHLTWMLKQEQLENNTRQKLNYSLFNNKDNEKIYRNLKTEKLADRIAYYLVNK